MANQVTKFLGKFQESKKLSMLTCYDSSFASLLAKSEVDSILVGDSVAMVMHGFDSTFHATMEMMESHVAAVSRGLKDSDKLLIGDMPFLSYRGNVSESVFNAGRLIRAGAQAIKLEGVKGHEESIQKIVESGIPVMGHLGLTPQSHLSLGGHRVQAKASKQAENLLEDAKNLEKLGAFSLVLECIPSNLAARVQEEVSIPVIGIGAGAEIAGQVLVLQDLLGSNQEFKPKFLRRYLNLEEAVVSAVNSYCSDVQNSSFPSKEESY